MKILLSQTGDKILLDDKDWLLLSNFKWQTTTGYAQGRVFGKVVYMHVYLCPHLKDQVTDHKDRNKLNNQKNNLRAVSLSVDCYNRGIFKNNKLGITGIRFRKDTKKFTAQFSINKKPFHLGSFKTLVEAKRAYIKLRKQYDF